MTKHSRFDAKVEEAVLSRLHSDTLANTLAPRDLLREYDLALLADCTADQPNRDLEWALAWRRRVGVIILTILALSLFAGSIIAR